jgi:hypothetical protein
VRLITLGDWKSFRRDQNSWSPRAVLTAVSRPTFYLSRARSTNRIVVAVHLHMSSFIFYCS